MNCGEKIKKYRTELGITQKELARRAHIATVSVQQYEAGVRNPKIETLCKIASGLDVPVDAIRSDSDLEFEALYAKFKKFSDSAIAEVSKENDLVSNYRKLNDAGQDKALEQVELLTKIPEYRKDTE